VLEFDIIGLFSSLLRQVCPLGVGLGTHRDVLPAAIAIAPAAKPASPATIRFGQEPFAGRDTHD